MCSTLLRFIYIVHSFILHILTIYHFFSFCHFSARPVVLKVLKSPLYLYHFHLTNTWNLELWEQYNSKVLSHSKRSEEDKEKKPEFQHYSRTFISNIEENMEWVGEGLRRFQLRPSDVTRCSLLVFNSSEVPIRAYPQKRRDTTKTPTDTTPTSPDRANCDPGF